jgi:hypothetical protein
MKLFASRDTRYFLIRTAKKKFQMRYRSSPFEGAHDIRTVQGTVKQAYSTLEDYVALKVITARLKK